MDTESHDPRLQIPERDYPDGAGYSLSLSSPVRQRPG